MLLVLDSNEYIGAFSSPGNTASIRLLDHVIRKPRKVGIVRSIVQEVSRNLSFANLKRFHSFLASAATGIDEDWEVPLELVEQYCKRGLRTGDAFVAVYTEWIGADVLLTENRDFLSLRSDLPFSVEKAEEFLRRPSREPKEN